MDELENSFERLNIKVLKCFCVKKRGWYPKCSYCLSRISMKDYEKHSKKFKYKPKKLTEKSNWITSNNSKSIIRNKRNYNFYDLINNPEKYKEVFYKEEQEFWESCGISGGRPIWMISKKPTYIFEELQL